MQIVGKGGTPKCYIYWLKHATIDHRTQPTRHVHLFMLSVSRKINSQPHRKIGLQLAKCVVGKKGLKFPVGLLFLRNAY
jgi:hypothetical protein